MVWYKQKPGQAPQQVGIMLTNAEPVISPEFKDKIKVEVNRSSTSLSIPYTTKDDEGTYYCGVSQVNMITFSTGTFLALTGPQDLNISVLQTPVEGPVPPGEPVTLQCTVLSEIRAADLRVLWFRAAAGQSFPEIIYTHQNSSSRQCEISSSTHSSVYNFSRNILNHHHPGTYYCAVAACGRIVFGNGTTVDLGRCSVEFLIVNTTSAHFTGPALAVDLHQEPLVSVSPGEAATLHCTFGEHMSRERLVWYKYKLGQTLRQVGSVMGQVLTQPEFEKLGIKLEANRSSFSLTIPRTTKDDEGMYFCGKSQGSLLEFTNGTFLAVRGHPEGNISVLQTPAQGPVSPREPVTLQCTVLSEIRAADLRVLWFRAAAGQSFPEIIYTHQNSSSRQCEISSSTHCSVYNVSRNILNYHHTGTYYCAVAACGKIIVGNGTAVELGRSSVELFTVSFFDQRKMYNYEM
ncbi:hypothetical protein NFI96_031883 [Prochilodus magdalenae]|nr:hypothetical protein NFI96_031883 [Prochilodus magdalenae]